MLMTNCLKYSSPSLIWSSCEGTMNLTRNMSSTLWESPPKTLRKKIWQLLLSVTFQGRCIGVIINLKNIKWVLYECIFWVKWSIINSRSSIKSSEFHIWNSINQNKMKILLFVFGLVLSNECYSCKGNSLDNSKESKDCFDDTKLNNANYKCTYGKYSCQVIRFQSLMLVTNAWVAICWRQLWDFGDSICHFRAKYPPSFNIRCHQYRKILSPRPNNCHQHNVNNIIVALKVIITFCSVIFLGCSESIVISLKILSWNNLQ